jgi:hypothetical protein
VHELASSSSSQSGASGQNTPGPPAALVPTSSTCTTLLVFVATVPAGWSSARPDWSHPKCCRQMSRLPARSGLAVKFGADPPPAYPGQPLVSVVWRTRARRNVNDADAHVSANHCAA